MDRVLDSRSEGLVFNSQCRPCVEVSGNLRMPHCLGPPSCRGYLVHRSKVGSIGAGCYVVEQRIQYKILLLTFKVLHGLAPQYLSELLKLQVTERDTRQTDTNRLHQPVMNTRTLGDRAFVAAAPTLWSSLPVKTRLVDSIDTFKKQTKTYLFPSSHK